MKKNLFLFLFLTLLMGCFGGSNAITRACYDAVILGSTVQELECLAGEPYAVHCVCSGETEYEYIEKAELNPYQVMAENHFYFRVVNGHVVSKCVRIETRPAYDLIYQADPNYPMFPPQAGMWSN